MLLRNFKRNSRRTAGTTMIVLLIGANMILLPLGLFAFEISRLQMATKQLKAATDAAALGAASFLANSSGSSASNMTKAKEIALGFFKKNMVMSTFLDHSEFSPSVDTDSPDVGTGTFDLLVDDTTGRVTAKAAFGLEPAFGKYLGIGTAPIHTHSLAGYEGLEGDIAMVVDISDSMTGTTHSVVAKRSYDAGASKVTYTVVRDSSACPTLGRLGSDPAIPDPDKAKWGESPLFAPVAGMPYDVKVAALVEAKRGNLESDAVFSSSHANLGAANGKITPQAGFKAAYQKLAMKEVQPLADEKQALGDFMAQLNGSDEAHLALVTFGGRASDGADMKDDFSTYSGHHYPHVNLDKGISKRQLVIDSLAPCLTFNGTDTKEGMTRAIDMLEGPAHRPECQKTIILLTDGVPTTGSPKGKAKEAGEKGIRLFAIGFFQTAAAKRSGPGTLNAMVAACGNGSKMYLAPDLPSLQDVLKQISHGTLALINED